MKDFQNKTAVITGAGSGIGKAIAKEAVSRGMKVVLADINESEIAQLQDEMIAKGGEAHAVPTDVSQEKALETLAKEAKSRFGNIHLLCNNAGVSSPPNLLWESTTKDWQWVLGVNLWSVIYGIKSFVPDMISHKESAYIVNTASIAGLISNQQMNAYAASKHAVVAMSETLYLDLQKAGANIGVSVLCPAWVKTQIHLSNQNRPKELSNEVQELDERTKEAADKISNALETGITPSLVATTTFSAIENERFYIFTHSYFTKLIQKRMEIIVEASNPKSSF